MGSFGLKAMVIGILVAIIGVVIASTVLGETIDDIQTAGNLVNATGAPLSGLYAGDGVLPLVVLGFGFIGVLVLAAKIAGGKSN